MSDFLKVLSEFGMALDGGVVNLLLVVGFVIVMGLVALVLKRVADNEGVQRLLRAWSLLDDQIASVVITLAYGEVDLSAAETESERLMNEENYSIDPRMLFLVWEIQKFAKEKIGLTLDLVTIHRRAERIFQVLKAEDNGLEV